MEPRRLSEPSVREPANDRGASCIERWKPAMPDMAERLLGAVGQVGCALSRGLLSSDKLAPRFSFVRAAIFGCAAQRAFTVCRRLLAAAHRAPRLVGPVACRCYFARAAFRHQRSTDHITSVESSSISNDGDTIRAGGQSSGLSGTGTDGSGAHSRRRVCGIQGPDRRSSRGASSTTSPRSDGSCIKHGVLSRPHAGRRAGHGAARVAAAR